MDYQKGIIYKTIPYKENSKLVYIYTNCGKKSFIARSINSMKSPYRALVQYMNEIKFKDSFKELSSLTEVTLENDFQDLKSDFQKFKTSALAIEIIDKLVCENETHEKIYNELLSSLNSPNIVLSMLSFAIRIIYLLGFGPNLEGNGDKIVGFAIAKAGLVYKGENYELDLDIKETLIFLKLRSKVFDFEISDMELFNIKRAIKKYYEYYLEITLKQIE